MNGSTKNQAKFIYIVEDDSGCQDLLREIVESVAPDALIEVTESAEIARARVQQLARERKNPFDLIITDIFLIGQITGLDLWQTCVETCPEVPVIVTSAVPYDGFLKTVGRTAISPPFLGKPFRASDCRALVEQMLKPWHARDSAA